MQNLQPLPHSWVEKIFQKLTLVYGRDFLGRYEGVSMPDVMADWAHELAGFQANGEAVKYALENIAPGKAPTVLEFRNLCRQAPARSGPALPTPKPSEEERADAVRICRQVGSPGTELEFAL